MEKVPLADWLSSVRAELSRAAKRYREQGAPPPGFILQDLTFEVEVSTEQGEVAGFEWKLCVISGKYDADDKDTSTQKMILKFKPISDVVMGDD